MGQPDIIHHLMQINLCCITLLKMNPECELSCFSHVQLFVTLWTVDRQGSSVSGILQARILERVAFSSLRVSSQARDRNQASALAGRFFTTLPPGKPKI